MYPTNPLVLAATIALCLGSSPGCHSSATPRPPAPREERAEVAQKAAKPPPSKLDPILIAQMRAAAPGERVNVAVWIAVDEMEEPRTTAPSPEARENRRRVREAVAAARRSLEEREALRTEGALEGAPVLFGAATLDQIARIAERPEVAGIYFYDPAGIDD
jgi:hypothetical protein